MFSFVADDLSVLKLDDTIAVFLSEILVMRDDDDEFLLTKLFENLKNLFASDGVECAGWFVCHDDLRVFDKGSSDGDSLFLAAR